MSNHLINCALSLLFASISVQLAAQITVSELSYHPDSSRNTRDWIELHNFSTSAVDIGNWYIKDSNPANRFDIPAGTNLAADAYLVLVRDIPAFTAQHPLVSNYIGSIPFGFANAGEAVNLYDASDNLMLNFSYEDTVPWPKTPDGRGRTLELIDPFGDLNDPKNWFAGCISGSPGTAFIGPCINAIIISEINYSSAPTNNPRDWVELYNTSDLPVNIGDWIFRDQNDSNEFIIPAGTLLAADSYLVLARELDSFNFIFPAVTNVIGDFPFNLSGNGEVLRLYNAGQILQFSVAYNDDLPWPESPDGGGKTLQIIDVFGNMDTHENWFAGCPLGSPGGPFDPACFTGLNDPAVHEPPEIQFGQQGKTISLQISQTSTSSDLVQWAIHNISGLELLTGSMRQNLTLNLSLLPEGTYLMTLRGRGNGATTQPWTASRKFSFAR